MLAAMRDLESLAARTWNRDIRPFVDEAVRCYNAGAFRAAVVTMWTAVCADVMEKSMQLAEDGAGAATDLSARIEKARSAGLSTEGVRTSQEVEGRLLQDAERLELITAIGRRHLERLKEDRNLCAHPSLLPVSGYFHPTPELARQHLTAAVEALLEHPPIQGREALERFKRYLCRPGFSADPDFIVATFLQSTQSGTQRQLVDLAAKHAVLELDPPPDVPITAGELADRASECILAFAGANRDLAIVTVRKALERLAPDEGAKLFRVLGRLGMMDAFWSAMTDRIRNGIVAALGTVPDLELPDTLLGLASSALVRAELPSLADRFQVASPSQKAAAIGKHPSPFFADSVSQLVADARSYRGAGAIFANAVLPMARHLSQVQLRNVLQAWSANDQCLHASAMPENAVALFSATRHLLPESLDAWQAFLGAVAPKDEASSFDNYYSYPALAAVVDREGNSSELH